MGQWAGRSTQDFHRDCAHDLNHPLRLRSLQAMIYLSNVTEETHCFSLSPESIYHELEDAVKDASTQLERSPPVGTVACAHPGATAIVFECVCSEGCFVFCSLRSDFHGPAGTVLLFNSSALHAAHCRGNGRPRKSVQIYYRSYGHPSGPIAHATVVPTSLWRDHADADVRAFYGASINERTRVFAEAFSMGSSSALPKL